MRSVIRVYLSPGIAFLWSSSDVGVASVTQNGVGKTQSDASPGVTTVRAAMDRATHNYGEARLEKESC